MPTSSSSSKEGRREFVAVLVFRLRTFRYGIKYKSSGIPARRARKKERVIGTTKTKSMGLKNGDGADKAIRIEWRRERDVHL
ncbi:hypothetical protein C0J52_18466 [Blattella germanica]|nr:hypothetical protein C0J52_18466 [Blattella germanica]